MDTTKPPRVLELVNRLEKGGRKTVEIFSGISDGQWGIVIYPNPDWTLRDLLAHFVSAETSLLSIAKDIANGGDGAPSGLEINALNESEMIRLKDHLPGELLKTLTEARQETIAWVKTLSEEQLDITGRHPALGVISLETMILAIYGHQLLHVRELNTMLMRLSKG